MSNRFEDLEPFMGLTVEAWVKDRWYAAIVTQVLPNSLEGKVSITLFHPISGALPYQNFPYWDEKSPDMGRVNCWRFIESNEE